MREGTYPSGCCRSEASSSTAVDDAIDARPGRVTVHIWSSVLSVSDCDERACQRGLCTSRANSAHVGGRNDVVAVIASKAFALRKRATHAVAHDEESIEPERRVHDDLPHP